jgi:hypothetical protein
MVGEPFEVPFADYFEGDSAHAIIAIQALLTC